jgi:type I restriction enzyme S subunit
MSFPRYRKYKASGVQWLGEVPAHWEVVRIKRVGTIRYGIGEPPQYHAEGTPLIRATNVHAGKLFTEGMVFVDPSEIPEQRIVWLAAGDVIVVRSGAYTGDSAIIPEDFGQCIAGFDMVLRCHSVRSEFIQFALLSKYLKEGQIDLEKMRAAQPHLNAEELGSCVVAVPSIQEQDKITTFLNRETAKIDELVAEQRRLMELLKEKRQAVISHAVTKGLNPHAPMKPSDIEWLGDVPEHWEVAPLRRFPCMVQTGPFGSQLHADEYVTGGTPVVNPVHMVGGKIVPSNDVTVSDEVVDRLSHQRLQVGDVIFSRRGELGRCALVTDSEKGWLCGTGAMILRLHHANYHSGYLSYFLSLDLLRQYFESFSIGAVMDSLSSETLLSVPMIVPPVQEQDSIVAFIKAESAKIDALTVEVQRAIDLLQERRTALISSAVTGQIDVGGSAKKIAA